jgi:hypothetical protein
MFGEIKTLNVWSNKNIKCLEKQRHKMFGEIKTLNVWSNKNIKCLEKQKH